MTVQCLLLKFGDLKKTFAFHIRLQILWYLFIYKLLSFTPEVAYNIWVFANYLPYIFIFWYKSYFSDLERAGIWIGLGRLTVFIAI